MGVAIENANGLVKVYGENVDSMGKALSQNSLRVSQLQGLNYSLSYLMASSAGGSSDEQVPLDLAVNMNLDIKEFPRNEAEASHNHESEEQKLAHGHKAPTTNVKFGMTRDKFLQFSRDMKQALSQLE